MSPETRAILILVLQVVEPLVALGFGACALLIARRVAPAPSAAAWRFAGAAFAVYGLHGAVQGIAAAAVMAAGERSPFFAMYLAVNPAGNLGRAFLMLGAAMGLLLLVEGRLPARVRERPAAVLFAALAVGTVVGAMQGSLAPRHYPPVAIAAVCTVLVLFAVLWRSRAGAAVDYVLWTALALFALREALSANFWIALSHVDSTLVWTPSALSFLAVSTGLLLPMLLCAAYRLTLLRAGRPTPSLFMRLRAG